jgi:SAM-dependent methyltransferase
LYKSAVFRKIDYERLGLAFLWLYHFENAAKVQLACREIPMPLQVHVLDAGCGSGASTVGLVSYLIDESCAKSARIDLVDRSATQLDIFNHTTGRYLRERLSHHATFHTLHEDICHFLQSKASVKNYDVILASNVLGELTPSNRRRTLRRMCDILAPGGSVLVIERKRTRIIESVRDAAKWTTFAMRMSGPHQIGDLEQLGAICPRYPVEKEFALRYAIFTKRR